MKANQGSLSSLSVNEIKLTKGAELYSKNCASCHGNLNSSAKLNKSFADIQNAIANIPAMSGLNFLNVSDIEAISYALDKNNCREQELLKPQIRRLTQKQYINTLESVFGNIFSQSDFPNFQDDNPTIGLANDPSNLTLDSLKMDRLYNSTTLTVDKILSSHSEIQSCASNQSSACVPAILEKFGPLLWRRPLDKSESSDLISSLQKVSNISGNNQRQLKFVLQALLLSNNFLFRQEIGELTGNFRTLNDFEIASLLSYSLWNYPPDSELYSLATNGSLKQPAVLGQQIQRMATDSRFTGAMSGFFEDYLKLGKVLTNEKETGIVNFNSSVRNTLLESAKRGLAQVTSTPNQSFMDVFTGNSFYINDATAEVFGINSSETSPQLDSITVSSEQRRGILSHPAFLASHSGNNNSGIVKRGVFVLEQLLCSPLGAPPDNVASVDADDLPPNFDPDEYSSRELIQITHSSQAQCMTCHSKIDPAGFGLENFDGFGRFRLSEKNNIPIDSSGSLQNVANYEIQFDDSVDYIDALSQTETMKACVVNHYYQYVMGQKASDLSCDSRDFESSVRLSGESVYSLSENIVKIQSFIRRTKE